MGKKDNDTKETKKRLLIDLDDVICQGAFLWAANKAARKTKANALTYEDLDEYEISKALESDRQKEIYYDICTNRDIYKHAYLLPNAYEVLEKLIQKYDVYITSACVYNTRPNESGKYHRFKFDYIIRALPFLEPGKFIFTNAKYMVTADFMIDDKLENLQGKHIDKKYLFDSYHNKKYTDVQLKEQGVERIKDWKEIESVLL